MNLKLFYPEDLNPREVCQVLRRYEDEYAYLNSIQLIQDYIDILKSLDGDEKDIEVCQIELEWLMRKQQRYEELYIRKTLETQQSINISTIEEPQYRDYESWKAYYIATYGVEYASELENFREVEDPEMVERLRATSLFQWCVTIQVWNKYHK